jgi:uncharacterized protein YwgA
MRESQEDPGRLVAEVVRASGGSVYGRVRMQKMFYLLDRMGLGSGLQYEYHHYGPYSAELTEEIKDAVAFGFFDETPARGGHLMGYPIVFLNDRRWSSGRRWEH